MPLTRWQKVRIGLPCLWVVAATFAPDIDVRNGLFRARAEDLVAVAMGLLAVLSLLTGRVRRRTLGVSERLVLCILAFGMLAALSFLVNAAGGTTLSGEGTFGFGREQEAWKELIRWGKYLGVAFAFSQVPPRAWTPVLGTLAACCAITVGIQAVQYVAADTINPWLIDFYAADPNGTFTYSFAWAKDASTFRSGSVMINPNVFAAFLIAPLFLFVMLLLESYRTGQSDRRQFRWLWLGMSGIAWLGLFFTQSRTALLATIFGMVVSVFLIPRDHRRKISRVGAWALVAVGVSILVFARTTSRYSVEGIGNGASGSLSEKIVLNRTQIQALGPMIIVGAGPGGGRQVDNELGYVVVWYGLIGFLAYLLFYRSLYHMISRRIANVYVRAAFTGILAAYLFGAIGGSFMLNNRVFPVFLALLTLACAGAVPVITKDSEPATVPRGAV
jgi:hypothetical protein